MESAIIMPAEELRQLIEKLDKVLIAASVQKQQGKDIVSNDELLKLLGISKRTAQVWRDEGLITFSQIKGKIFYRMADIQELLLKHQRKSF